MQNPIIFLATADLKFEETAVDAIFANQHGIRCARNIREACHLLGEGTGDIVLAIIDLDLHQQGISLLRIIAGSEPRFPILVVADDAAPLMHDETITTMAGEYLIKPIEKSALTRRIHTLCEQAPLGGYEFQTAPYGHQAIGRAVGCL